MTLSGGGHVHAFPWREEEAAGGRRVQRPTLTVRLSAGDLTHRTKALVDTGAPVCVFPRGVGDLLGIEFGGASYKIGILKGEWPAVRECVSLVLEPFENDAWDADVFFVRDEGLPFALLGYEGFLNRWAVSFNGAYGYFTVERADESHRRQRPEVLQTLREQWPHLIPREWV